MPIDRAKVLRRTEEAQSRTDEFKEWPGRLQPLSTAGTTDLRIFEYTSEDGSRVFAHPIKIHRCTAKGKLVDVCTEGISDKPCYCCMINDLALKLHDLKPFNSQLRYVINAADVDYFPEKVRLFVIPMTVFSQIAQYVLTDRWAHVLEAKRGQVFSIKRWGNGLNTRYSVKLIPAKHPVGSDIMDQVIDPLTEIKHANFNFYCSAWGCNQICKYPLNPV